MCVNSVPVPHSCRGLLFLSLPLNKETFNILHSELLWDYIIIVYNRLTPTWDGAWLNTSLRPAQKV